MKRKLEISKLKAKATAPGGARIIRLFKSLLLLSIFILKKKLEISKLKTKTTALGGARTPDLRITSAPSAVYASTAYKYDALTDCATGAEYETYETTLRMIKQIENVWTSNFNSFLKVLFLSFYLF